MGETSGMQRVRVVGNSGSGKTRLAAELARRLELPHLELDAINNLADWQEAPQEQFRAGVQHFLDTSERSHQGWVVEGNYGTKLGGLLDAADTYVWLDYPRWLVMSRVVRRSLGRLITRKRLWHGNRERLRSLLSTDDAQNIVLWSWTHHDVRRRQYGEAMHQAPATVEWVRLRSPREATAWLRSAAATAPDRPDRAR